MYEKFFVSPDVADEMEYLLLGNKHFPWYYNKSTLDDVTEREKNDKGVDNPQFTHVFYFDQKTNSHHYKNVMKILREVKLPFKKIYLHKIKANLNYNVRDYKENDHQLIHTDMLHGDYKSFIYYVNETDGDTLFFNDRLEIIDRVSPKKGMGILFDSNTKHAAQNPIKYYTRAVINFVWSI